MRCVRKVCDPITALKRDHWMRDILQAGVTKTLQHHIFTQQCFYSLPLLTGWRWLKRWPYLANGIYLSIYLVNPEAATHNEAVKRARAGTRWWAAERTELDADNWSTNPNVMSVSHKGADSLPKNSSKPRKSSHLFSSFMNACLSSPAMRNTDGETLKT